MGLIEICTNYLIFQKHLMLLFGPIFSENLKLSLQFSWTEKAIIMKFGRNKSHHFSKIIQEENSGKLFSAVSMQKIGTVIIANFKSSLWIIISLIAISNAHFDCKMD